MACGARLSQHVSLKVCSLGVGCRWCVAFRLRRCWMYRQAPVLCFDIFIMWSMMRPDCCRHVNCCIPVTLLQLKRSEYPVKHTSAWSWSPSRMQLACISQQHTRLGLLFGSPIVTTAAPGAGHIVLLCTRACMVCQTANYCGVQRLLVLFGTCVVCDK
jgi:hypothetical protein